LGRRREVAQLEQALDAALTQGGRVLAITGGAGLGKSRLVVEGVRLARAKGFTIYGGECESYGVNSSYLVWKSIWRGLLGVDAASSVAEQIRQLQQGLAEIDPAFAARHPLLTPVLDIPIPDNDLTRALDAKLRKTSLESLLVDCVRHLAAACPLLIVLEDCHWLDPLSHDLLEAIARAVADRPVLLLVSYRPLRLDRLRTGRVSALPNHDEIVLSELSADESAQLVEQKLAQLHSDGAESAAAPLPSALRQRIVEQAEGNPFYVEELINYLHFRDAPAQADLPDSLHQLVLSRLDQLGEEQQITLKVASVIGRVFRAAWLHGVYPDLGDAARVRRALTQLTRQELTQREPSEPELTYLFKQIITRNVAYESLPFAVRAIMHEQIGEFIENAYPDQLEEQYLDLLAYHYERSENVEKQREYLLRAGAAAQADYALAAAISYYERALPLLQASQYGETRVETMLKLGQVMELDGQWQAVETLYAEALDAARSLGDGERAQSWQAQCAAATGELLRKQGRYDEASTWLERARAGFEALDDRAGVGQVLHYLGTLAAQQGDYARARSRYERSLGIRRQIDDQPNVASLLSNLGILARFEDDYARAQQLYTESLAIRRSLGDRWAIANSLNNLGLLARYRDDFDTARAVLEESLAISRELGDKWSIANTLTSLAEIALDQGDGEAARGFLVESLRINRTLGEQRAIAFVLECFAALAAPDEPARALRLAGAAHALREAIGAPLSPAEQSRLGERLAPARKVLNDAAQQAAVAEGQSLSLGAAIETALGS
jgi:predicted ATPase